MRPSKQVSFRATLCGHFWIISNGPTATRCVLVSLTLTLKTLARTTKESGYWYAKVIRRMDWIRRKGRDVEEDADGTIDDTAEDRTPTDG
jgi:hypothetical protein